MADPGIVKSGEVPQIQHRPNREALARYGLEVGDFQHIFQAAVGVVEVATFWEAEVPRPVVLPVMYDLAAQLKDRLFPGGED